MVKIDLHVHTTNSDGFGSVKEVILEAKRKKLDGIAITDHNTMSGIKEAKKLAKKLNFIIIPGEEVSTKEGHVLALGIKKAIRKGLSAEKTIEKIHKQNGIAIAAHPYGFILHRECVKDLVKELDFDAIEVFNSTNLIENAKALEVANEINKVQVAGSDAHILEQIGNAYTLANCKPDADSFLKEIKTGNVLWLGKKIKAIDLAKYALKKLPKFFRHRIKSLNKRKQREK